MNVLNSQRTQTAGCCLDTGTQSWQSPASSGGQHRWGRPCIRPCWTPDSFLEAPRKNCKGKKDTTLDFTLTIWLLSVFFLAACSHTCCRWACHLRGDCSPGRLPGYWTQQAWNPIGRSGRRCRGSSFPPHTGYTPEPTSLGTPRRRMRRLEDKEREKNINKSFHNLLCIQVQKSYKRKITPTEVVMPNHCCIQYNVAPVMRELNPYILLHTVSVSASFSPIASSSPANVLTVSAFPHTWSAQMLVTPLYASTTAKKMCVVRSIWG